MKKTIFILSLMFIYHPVVAQTGNEFLGANAGASTIDGDFNVIIGDDAGAENVEGSSNVIMGYQAAESYQGNSTFDSENVIIGSNACRGVRNVADDGWDSRCDVDDAVIIGKQAGMVLTTGFDLVIIGQDAGMNMTTANDSVIIGSRAGLNLTTGYDNVSIGEESAYNLTTGFENVAIGFQALYGNEIGRHNVAVGNEAGNEIGATGTSASWNTAVGDQALVDSGVGVGNTAIGGGAGGRIEHADFSTFVGISSGGRTNISNGTGNALRNTGLGAYSGYSNEEGSDNVWVGGYAGTKRYSVSAFDDQLDVTELETCTNNCYLHGPVSQNTSTAGAEPGGDGANRTTVLGNFAAAGDHDSVVVGYNAWARNERSVVMGANAEAYNIDSIILGDNANAAIGTDRAIALGADAVVTHADSINIGYGVVSHAVNTMTVGGVNTISWDPGTDAVTTLGTSSYRMSDVFSNKISVNAASTNSAEIDLFADAGAANDDKWTITAANGGDFSISSFASGADVDKLTIANTGDVVIAGDLALNSDRRLKTNINSVVDSLDKVMQLDGKSYYWKDKNRKKGEHLGFIAQEVESVLPNLVSQDKQGIKSVNYQGMMPVLVNAIKELNKKSINQEQTILQLQDFIQQQQALIIKLAK